MRYGLALSVTNERKIICVREGSSMVSTWNEYLCVANISTGVGRIDVCGYEALGEYQTKAPSVSTVICFAHLLR